VSVELKSVTPAFNHLCDEDLAFINLAVLSVFRFDKGLFIRLPGPFSFLSLRGLLLFTAISLADVTGA
jgi:hypothetical protein